MRFRDLKWHQFFIANFTSIERIAHISPRRSHVHRHKTLKTARGAIMVVAALGGVRLTEHQGAHNL